MFCTAEVIPLWAISTEDSGGLAYQKEALALLLSAASALSAAYMLLGGRLIRHVGLKPSIVGATFIDAIVLLVLPMSQVSFAGSGYSSG